MHKSLTQPLCRCCGKPIRKWTDNHYASDGHHVWHTKAEVERASNERVVSVSYETVPPNEIGYLSWALKRGAQAGERIIYRYSTWDGESYMDDLFCSGTCAERFARFAVDHVQTRRYAQALQAQKIATKENAK